VKFKVLSKAPKFKADLEVERDVGDFTKSPKAPFKGKSFWVKDISVLRGITLRHMFLI
jgi:hypothetical protein